LSYGYAAGRRFGAERVSLITVCFGLPPASWAWNSLRSLNFTGTVCHMAYKDFDPLKNEGDQYEK
jgi:hypothetical protein